ncbi:MAG: MFS family permease [Planctomycetota bacterium]|jgi:MFS family permease
MQQRSMSTVRISLIVALGGFLLGFDSAVISGVVGPVQTAFDLSDGELGWTVSCLILGAMFGNMAAGPLADRFGRRTVLRYTAALFTISALGSALATGYTMLVIARILGGLAVGGAILIAPIYIAEIAPPERRGRLVSFNQLNIVVGISAAFFTNYFINQSMPGAASWRWMLGVESVPALLYLVCLFRVPCSPRWLARQGRLAEAKQVFTELGGSEYATESIQSVTQEQLREVGIQRAKPRELFSRRMRWIMTIALSLAFFQQITGINAIFYYAPTIFEKAGAGAESALEQAILIGLVNLGFTLVAMWLIDRLGRKPLLLLGSAGMAIALFINAAAFSNASYVLDEPVLAELERTCSVEQHACLSGLKDQSFDDEAEFRRALRAQASAAADIQGLGAMEHELVKAGLHIDGRRVLMAIMLYIASFAISLGPVMWAMLSEIFPARVRGLGISAAGVFNSAVAFLVTQLFPWELSNLGPALTFLIYGVFAALAFLFTLVLIPETKGRSLEEIETLLVRV